MKIAYPYLRESTPDQMHGDGPRRQREWHEKVAAEKGLTLDYSLKLVDAGKSAYHGDNLKAGLGRFLAAIADGRVKPGEVLLAEELDRASRRHPKKAIPLIIGILSAGVEIITREKHYTEDSIGDLAALVDIWAKASTAHEESRKKSERISANWAAWREQVARGEKVPPPGKMPSWMRWDGKEFSLEDDEAAVIREIYRLAGDGWGIERITKKLGLRFASVGDLLRDRRVVGELTTKDGKTYQGFYPAVIPEAEWWRVRGAMVSRRRPRTKGEVHHNGRESMANLFTGLLYDGPTGAVLHQHHYRQAQGGERRNYVTGRAREAEVRGASGMPVLPFERAFLRFVKGLSVADLLGPRGDGVAERRAALEGEKLDLTAKLEATRAKLKAVGPVDALLDIVVEWDARLKVVDKELGGLKARPDTPEEGLEEAHAVILLLERLEGGEEDELRRRLKVKIRSLVERILVNTHDIDECVRGCRAQVVFRGGGVKVLGLAWFRRGLYPGLAIGWGFEGDGTLRDLSEPPSEEIRIATRRALEEEVAFRAALATKDREDGKDTLGLYLTGTLDGLRLPDRRRKVKV